jgi:hypothetical protein
MELAAAYEEYRIAAAIPARSPLWRISQTKRQMVFAMRFCEASIRCRAVAKSNDGFGREASN